VQRTAITLLHDGCPGGTGRYYVTVTIGSTEHTLGVHDDVNVAAASMAKWVADRGLSFAPDSALRLARAQRLDADVLTLDVWTRADYDAHVEARRTAWQRADYDPYIHIAYRMGTRDTFPWLNTWA
jgi:hypothetical protein